MFDHPISQFGYVLVGLLVCTLILYPFIGVLYVSILHGAHWILMVAAPAWHGYPLGAAQAALKS